MKKKETGDIYVKSPAPAGSLEEIIKELKSPRPLKQLDELGDLITPKPKYVGPGMWLNVLKESVKDS